MAEFVFPHNQFSNYMKNNFGLSLISHSKETIENKVKEICKELCKIDFRRCLADILSTPPTKLEVQILSKYFLINDSYFFRDSNCFETLEKDLLPDIILKRTIANQKYIRIWSAGCSGGEEPYSLAILLHRLIPDLKNWDITILGTDINSDNLKKAQKGIYTQWSFRDTPDWLKKEYFKNSGSDFEIDPSLKETVSFFSLNLVQNSYPDTLNNTSSMDIILCRNVLMYLETDVREKIIERFYQSLVPGGILIVSPAEATPFGFSKFSNLNFEKSIFYKKDDIEKNRFSVDIFISEVVSKTVVDEGFQNKLEPIVKKELSQKQRIKLLANKGEFQKALNECETLLKKENDKADLYYLYALILSESKRHSDAVEALQKTLYLNNDCIVAHIALGKELKLIGRIDDAIRSIRYAHSLLQSLDPQSSVENTDGLSAGHLINMIQLN